MFQRQEKGEPRMQILRTTLLKVFAVSAIAILGVNICDAQGIAPNGVSQVYSPIDTVDVKNGTAFIQLPLFSVPQRGTESSLDFILTVNTSPWTPPISGCNDTSCTFRYVASLGVGPQIKVNNFFSLGENDVDLGREIPPMSAIIYRQAVRYAIDGNGSQHQLWFDSANPTHARTVDGSGYLAVYPANSTPYDPFSGTPYATLYDAKGRKLTYDASSRVPTITDQDGNSVTRTSSGGSNVWTDTIGRTITEPNPLSSTNTAQCPSAPIGAPSPVQSSTWNVPGYDSPFLLCYTYVYIHTNFWGNNGQYFKECDPNSCRYYESWEETEQQTLALQSITYPDQRVYKFVYDTAPNSSSSTIAYGTVTRVILPTGGSISYCYDLVDTPQYDEAIQAKYPSEHYVDTVLPFVVRRVENTTDTAVDCSSTSAGWTYTPFSSSSASTYSATETDPLGNAIVHTFDYNTSNLQGYSWEGTQNEVSRDYYSGSSKSGTLLKHVAEYYVVENLPYPSVAPSPGYPSQTWLPSGNDTTTDGILTTSTSTTYTNFFTPIVYTCQYNPGNQSSACQSTTGNQSISLGIPTSTAIGGVTTTTHYMYETNPTFLADNILTSPSSVSYTDTASSFNTSWTYDDSSYTTASNGAGHPTTVTISNPSGSNVVTHTHYGEYGMADAWIDGNLATTASVAAWDSNHLFPSTVSTPLGSLSYLYDSGSGRIQNYTDINGYTTSYAYTSGGRIQSIRYPSITSGYSVYYCYPDLNTIYQYNAQNNAVSSISSCGSPIQGATIQSTLLDAFGRQSAQVSASGATTTTAYDAIGRIIYTSNPYFSSDGSIYYTSYSYDALGRIRYMCNPDNGTAPTLCAPNSSYRQWTYRGNLTTLNDENSNSWKRSFDSFGRLTQVIEPNNAVTQYTYDARNNLRTVIQHGLTGNITLTRSFNYDGSSRLLSASNPESGTTTYTYDGNSNLLTKTDARGIVVTYGYAAANRLKSKSYSDNVTPTSCYQYDSSSVANGIGRPSNQWTQSASAGACALSAPSTGFLTKRSILAYDPMGRILNEQQYTQANLAGGTPYALAYTYDLAGNLLTSTSGVGPASTPITLTNTFDSSNRLQTLTSNWSNSGVFPATLFSSPSYAASGGLTGAIFGSGLTLSRAYNNRLRITGETDTGSIVSAPTPGSATVTINGSEQSQ
jgi:YD repeat-containing protein